MNDRTNPRGATLTKRGYSANGLGRSAVETIVDDTERTFTGTSAHPWPAELKEAMVDACNGATQPGDIKERIERLRQGHEEAVFVEEREIRATARAAALGRQAAPVERKRTKRPRRKVRAKS